MADNYDEYRQSKLEDAITKLTEISADLNKMIAVHELRLNQQEKTMDSFVDVLEKRREEYERKEKDLYKTIEQEDNRVVQQIEESFDKLSKKIGDLEKMMWVYGGGIMVLAFIIANWGDVFKFLPK